MYVNRPAAGFFGELFCRTEISAAKSAVVNDEHVNHGVGALRSFDGFVKAYFAAVVVGIGQDDESFAPGLRGHLIVAGEINSVIEICAARAAGWKRSRGSHAGAARCIDSGTANGAIQF